MALSKLSSEKYIVLPCCAAGWRSCVAFFSFFNFFTNQVLFHILSINFTTMSYNKRLLCVLMTATLSSSFAVCLFPPFFPRLAEEKGYGATIYGFVIGVNCLTSFLVTPIIGKNVNFLFSKV